MSQAAAAMVPDRWEQLVPYCPVLGKYLSDDGISEIEVNPDGMIYIEESGVTHDTGETASQPESAAFITRVARWRGQNISDLTPLLTVQMPDGSRVSAVCPPVSSGWCFTIRKKSKMRWTMAALVANGTLTATQADTLVSLIADRKSLLISGGTSSGKTSLLTALGDCVPSNERIVVIEDVSEISINLPNVVRFEAQPSNEKHEAVTIRDLVKHSLRFTPNRIILGEVRGEEAFDLLQVLNTGHAGSLSTIHANSAARALSRLGDLTMQADVGVAERFIHKSIAEAINVVVQVERRGAGRRVAEIVRIDGYDTVSNEYSFTQL